MHAQFSVIPPLGKIQVLFKDATDKEMIPGIHWSVWKTPPSTCIEELRPYYRPCHMHILNETLENPAKTPCALLRQLLRPHNLQIQKKGSVWVLNSTVEKAAPVILKEGGVVDWGAGAS